jgi:hypothetical protein
MIVGTGMNGQDVVQGAKFCAKCERRLPLEAFGRNAATRSGLSSWCRGCHNDATRRSRQARR